MSFAQQLHFWVGFNSWSELLKDWRCQSFQYFFEHPFHSAPTMTKCCHFLCSFADLERFAAISAELSEHRNSQPWCWTCSLVKTPTQGHLAANLAVTRRRAQFIAQWSCPQGHSIPWKKTGVSLFLRDYLVTVSFKTILVCLRRFSVKSFQALSAISLRNSSLAELSTRGNSFTRACSRSSNRKIAMPSSK